MSNGNVRVVDFLPGELRLLPCRDAGLVFLATSEVVAQLVAAVNEAAKPGHVRLACFVRITAGESPAVALAGGDAAGAGDAITRAIGRALRELSIEGRVAEARGLSD